MAVLNLIVDAPNEQDRAVNRSKIAVLCVSYKAGIGDYRESSTEPLVLELVKRGARVRVVDLYIARPKNARDARIVCYFCS